MSNEIKNKLKTPEYEGHGFPVTRRGLLQFGAIQLAATVTAPWWARAHRFGELAAPTIPMLVFDLAGGAGLPGNFLVGKKEGAEDLCESYRMLGWNPRESDSLEKCFGLPMSKKYSKMLEGIQSQLRPDMYRVDGKSLVQMGSYLHFSLDDTSTNQSSVLSMISRAGLKGSKTKSALGLRSTLSGGNSRCLLEDPAMKPKTISSVQDLLKIASMGTYFDGLAPERRKAILQILIDQGLEAAEKAGLKDAGLTDAYQNTINLGVQHNEGDARQDALFQKLYGINANTQLNAPAAIEASVVLNVLKRYTGPGVITIGGCDYHVNNAATSDAKDKEIGISIGRALRAAAEIGTPLFFQILTDGGVYAADSASHSRNWVGDSNQRSMGICGFFHPTKPPEMIRTQVGAYTAQGVVDQNTPVGSGPQMMVLGTLANYLSVNGQLSRFEEITGRSPRNINLDDLMLFA